MGDSKIGPSRRSSSAQAALLLTLGLLMVTCFAETDANPLPATNQVANETASNSTDRQGRQFDQRGPLQDFAVGAHAQAGFNSLATAAGAVLPVNLGQDKLAYAKQLAFYTAWKAKFALLNTLFVAVQLATAAAGVGGGNKFQMGGKEQGQKQFRKKIVKKIMKKMKEKRPSMFDQVSDKDLKAMANFLSKVDFKESKKNKKQDHKFDDSGKGRKFTPSNVFRFQEFFDDDPGLDLSSILDYLPEGLPLSPPGGSLFPGAPELDSLVLPQSAGILGFPPGGFGFPGGFPGFFPGYFNGVFRSKDEDENQGSDANQNLLETFGLDGVNVAFNTTNPFVPPFSPFASIDKKPAFINKPLTTPAAVAQLHLAEHLVQAAIRPQPNKPSLVRPPVILGPPQLRPETLNSLLTTHGIHPNLLPTRPDEDDDDDEHPAHPVFVGNPLGPHVVPVTAPVRPGYPFAPTFTYHAPSVPELLAHVGTVLNGGAVNFIRAGPKPLLAQPDPKACATRRGDFQFGQNGYQFSWLQPGAPTRDWFNARNYCRRQCMDLVSLETAEENEAIKGILDRAWKKGQIPYIWTSGRMCDFDGCDRPDLQPLEIEGWFWTATGAKLYYPGKGFNDWGAKQPDNREHVESCVAFMNPSIYKDPSGQFTWHDVGCHYQKPFICEDNDRLIQFATQLRENDSKRSSSKNETVAGA